MNRAVITDRRSLSHCKANNRRIGLYLSRAREY